MIDYEKAEALIGTEKYPEAIALLAAEPVSILDDGNFERMERCLSSLPEQVLQQSPEGCFLALSADLRLGRANSARQWFNQLAVLRDQCPEGSPARAAVVRYVCLAGIMLPQTDNAQILLLLSILHNETISHRLPPVHLSATGAQAQRAARGEGPLRLGQELPRGGQHRDPPGGFGAAGRRGGRGLRGGGGTAL